MRARARAHTHTLSLSQTDRDRETDRQKERQSQVKDCSNLTVCVLARKSRIKFEKSAYLASFCGV